MRKTLGYAIVGLILGSSLPWLVGVVVGVCASTLGAPLGLRSNALIILMVLGSVLLSAAIMYHATRGTCSRSPVGPGGVAIGVGIGVALWAPITAWWVIRFGDGMPVAIANLIAVVLLPWATRRGGAAGIRRNLGMLQIGVGTICARCAYDMRGLPDMTVCPECGGSTRYAGVPSM